MANMVKAWNEVLSTFHGKEKIRMVCLEQYVPCKSND